MYTFSCRTQHNMYFWFINFVIIGNVILQWITFQSIHGYCKGTGDVDKVIEMLKEDDTLVLAVDKASKLFDLYTRGLSEKPS